MGRAFLRRLLPSTSSGTSKSLFPRDQKTQMKYIKNTLWGILYESLWGTRMIRMWNKPSNKPLPPHPGREDASNAKFLAPGDVSHRNADAVPGRNHSILSDFKMNTNYTMYTSLYIIIPYYIASSTCSASMPKLFDTNWWFSFVCVWRYIAHLLQLPSNVLEHLHCPSMVWNTQVAVRTKVQYAHQVWSQLKTSCRL